MSDQITTLNRIQLNSNEPVRELEVVYQKISSTIYAIQELSEECFLKYKFGLCLFCQDSKTKLIYVIAINNTNNIQRSSFALMSCQNRDTEYRLFDLVSSMVEIDSDQVICSHYDGSLILYKKFKERCLKVNPSYYQDILVNAGSEMNTEQKVIINIACFKKEQHFLLRLEHFDSTTTEIIFERRPSDFKLISSQQGEKSQFLFRKYLREEQIVAGFVDAKTFGVIQKQEHTGAIQLTRLIKYPISDELVDSLFTSSDQDSSYSLEYFDVTIAQNMFYIVCVYKVNGRCQLIGFTIQNKSDENSTMKLHTILQLENQLGRINELFAIKQESKFRYDAVIVYEHFVIAYQLFNIDDLNKTECIIRKDLTQQIHYHKYHYSEIQDVGFHLLVSTQANRSQVEYFNTIDV